MAKKKSAARKKSAPKKATKKKAAKKKSAVARAARPAKKAKGAAGKKAPKKAVKKAAKKAMRKKAAPARRKAARRSGSRAAAGPNPANNSGAAQTTRDHDVIRRWIEERGGVPSTVSGTQDESGAGVLRVDFPVDGQDRNLEPVQWDEFFAKFDEANVEFLYQDQMADGSESRFFKFVSAGQGK